MRLRWFAVLACVLLVGSMTMAATLPTDGKLHVVFFQDAAGVQHPYWLDRPVSFSDALAVRDALFGLARACQAKGDDSFLRALTQGQYTDNGSMCYVTSRSGGRAYYCGQCGGVGCAQVKAITNSSGPLDGPTPPPKKPDIVRQ